MQLLAEKLEYLMQVLLIADELPAVVNLELHELVDFVLPLHVLLQLYLQVVDLVLGALLHLYQVRVVLFEVRRFFLLQQRQLRLFVKRPLVLPLAFLLYLHLFLALALTYLLLFLP